MKNIMILATLALALSPSLASATEPAKHAPQQQNTSNTSNGTRQNSNQYHDRTPVVHDRGQISPR